MTETTNEAALTDRETDRQTDRQTVSDVFDEDTN